jgi:predicted negative regulator of RcsB-dependent stress response
MTEKYFKKNSELLLKRYPEYEWLLSENRESAFDTRVIKNDGYLGLKVEKSGCTYQINSSVSPEKEAEAIVEELDLKPGELRILVGMGLGYLPKAILKRNIPYLKVIVIIPYDDIFVDAIKHMDLSDIIDSEDVCLILEEDLNISYYIMTRSFDVALMTKGVNISYYEPEREINPERFKRISQSAIEQINDCQMQINTATSGGPTLFKNAMSNITSIINSCNVGVMHNIFENYPVIIAGAGPSLKDDIPVIKKFQNQILIFCVDTALPVLIENGVTPDLVGAVDYHPVSYDKYRHIIEKTSDIPLLFHNACSSMVVKPYRSKIKFFIAEQLGIIGEMVSFWDGKWAKPPSMNAVPHLAIFAAIVTGASPIIFSGLDLGYVGLKSYAEGATMKMNLDLSSIVWGEDNYGEPIATGPQMISQRVVIENLIKMYPGEYLNSSKGLQINGASKIELEYFLKKIELQTLNKRKLISDKFYSSKKPENLRVVALLKEQLNKLDSLKKKYSKGKQLASKTLICLKNNKADCKKKVLQVSDYYDENKNVPQVLRSCVQLFVKDEIMLRCKEYEMNVDMVDLVQKEKVVKEIQYVEKWFDVRISSVMTLEKIYRKLEKRLYSESILKEKLESIGERDPKRLVVYIELGKIYFKYNDFNESIDAYEQALKICSTNSEALFGLARNYVVLKNYKSAIEIFDTLLETVENDSFLKLIKNEMCFFDRQLKLAEEYIVEGAFSSGAENRTYWGLRICNDILAVEPDNEKALMLKKQADKKIERVEKDNKELLPIISLKLDFALEQIEKLRGDDIDKAIRYLEILKRQKYGEPKILELLALCLMEKGDYKEAKNYLIQASTIASNEVSPCIHLANIYLKEGDNDNSLQYLKEANRRCDSSIPAINKIIGDIYLNEKEFEKSIEYYQKELKLNPTDIETMHNLALSYSSLGNFYASSKINELISKFS